MPSLKPGALRPGDRVAIVAPASPFSRDEFDEGLAQLRALGYVPEFDDTIFDRRRYLAGDAATRARVFLRAWQDPGIRAVFTARGGYGSAQLLPYLPCHLLRATPTLLVGYSDITSLLSVITTRCGMVALHGPTVTGRLGRGEATYDRISLVHAMTSTTPLGALSPPGLESIVDGEASGLLFGGNLTQISASLGTPWAFDPPQGAVLFVEDVNERPYRLDRLLTQLRHAGILNRASALVFGDMPGCDEPGGEMTAREVVGDLVRDFAGPVLWGFPSGHTGSAAITLPLGVQARVVAGASPALIIEEAAVTDAIEKSRE
jgi:muramoyltetrapeptide carboxypeptidase